MTHFVAGLLVMGYTVAAMYFMRFWRETRDALFLFFAAGFALLAIQRTTLAIAYLIPVPMTTHYVLRLAAFVVILAGILHKNRR
ncbi:MAG TPA: DUF5985 family protein [Gemmatimonadaceae bacterium]|nr:DUF5985 family protein [Gemmatimonadaceae bacterium]